MIMLIDQRCHTFLIYKKKFTKAGGWSFCMKGGVPAVTLSTALQVCYVVVVHISHRFNLCNLFVVFLRQVVSY